MLAFIRLMSKTSSVIVWPSSLFKSLVSHCDFLGYEDAACKVHVTLFFVLFFVIIISLEKDNFRPLDFRIIFPNSVLLLFLRVNYIFFSRHNHAWREEYSYHFCCHCCSRCWSRFSFQKFSYQKKIVIMGTVLHCHWYLTFNIVA